jgi:hypothetical protein
LFSLAVDLAQKSYPEVGRGATIINIISLAEWGNHLSSFVPLKELENFAKLAKLVYRSRRQKDQERKLMTSKLLEALAGDGG